MEVVTIRASALADFLDCPARAEAKHLRGLRTPTNGKALLGTALHRSTAVYDQARLDGYQASDTALIKEAAGAAVDAIHKPDEDVEFEEDMGPQTVEDIAVSLHGRYCLEIAPSQNYSAVEVHCERLEITDIGIALTGTTDRVRRLGEGAHGIADVKSGKAAVNAQGGVKTHGHAYQVGVYELLADKASDVPITEPGKIIGLQTGKTARGQRVAVSDDIVGARDVLIGDDESPGVLETVAHMIHSGNFPGNPRSMLCHERYCPIFNICKFRK